MQNQPHPTRHPFIASLLTALIGVGMLAQSFAVNTSAQTLGGITVIEPAGNTTWFWGESYTVRFTTETSVAGVTIFLSKGGAASGLGGGWGGAMINSGCATDPLQTVQSCSVTLPAKPAEIEDGEGFFVILDEIGAVGQPKRGIAGVTMASSQFGEFGVSLGLGIESNTIQSNDLAVGYIQVNSNTVLPAGEKIRRAQVTLNYDQTKVSFHAIYSPSDTGFTTTYNQTLSDQDSGIAVLDILLTDESSYPNSGEFIMSGWTWMPVAVGLAHTEIDWSGAKIAGDGSDVWLSASAGSDTYGDMLIELDQQSADFQVVEPQSNEVSGTYYSQKQYLTTGAQRFVSLEKFTPVYNDNLSANGITSDTKFALGFFDTNGKNLCNTVALPNDPANTACGTPGEFDADGSGYFLITVDASGQDYPLTGLNNRSWTSQIASVQTRVYMSTSDYEDQSNPSQPWVQSMSLTFNADTLGVVGGVFGQNATVARGGSVNYSFVIDPNINSNYTGTTTWSITPVQAGTTAVTFSPATGSVVFDGSDAAVTINTTLAATQGAAVDSPYLFNIEAHPSDTSIAFLPAQIAVTVTADGTAQFSIVLNPASANVTPGGTTAYEVSANRSSGFTGDIQLTDNIATIFGDDVATITYQPTSRLITGSGKVTITVTAASANTSATPRSFTVTGTSGSSTATATGQLTITSASNLKSITLEITAPIEGGQDSGQPMFSFRLYDASNLKVFEKTDIKTTTDKATVAITNLNVNGVYRGFVRTTRHLWRQGDATITVAANQDNYSMSFIRLLAGDVDPNNVINAVDLPVITRDWGKTGTGIIPDIDANGAVNSLDIVNFFANYFKTGSTLPGS